MVNFVYYNHYICEFVAEVLTILERFVKRRIIVNQLLIIIAMNLMLLGPEIAYSANIDDFANRAVTIIDVVSIMDSSESYNDVAIKLSSSYGLDRTKIIDSLMTDKNSIIELINLTNSKRNIADVTNQRSHKSLGDKYSQEMIYSKAAKEYTVSISSLKDVGEVYMLRGNSYMNYLTKEILPQSGNNLIGFHRTVINDSVDLLCKAVYSDYTKAKVANSRETKNVSEEIRYLEYNSRKNNVETGAQGGVHPYYAVSAQRSVNTAKLRNLYQIFRNVKQVDASLVAALVEYNKVCKGNSH